MENKKNLVFFQGAKLQGQFTLAHTNNKTYGIGKYTNTCSPCHITSDAYKD